MSIAYGPTEPGFTDPVLDLIRAGLADFALQLDKSQVVALVNSAVLLKNGTITAQQVFDFLDAAGEQTAG